MGDNNALPKVIVSSSERPLDEAITEIAEEQGSRYTYEGDGLVPIVDIGDNTLGSLLRYYEIYGIDGRYWTPKLLRHILSRDRVEAEVKRTKQSWGDSDIQYFVDAVYPKDEITGTKSYLRIFALLVLAERVRDLAKFIRHGVCDEKLPIAIVQTRTQRLVYLERDKSKPLECFEGWSDNDKECFERNQWSVTAPFFDLTKERICKEFHLHHSTFRPWRKSEDSAALENCGAYGAVTLVEFHPTSHSFHNALTGIKLGRSRLAIKTLYDAKFNDEQQFRRELDQLKRFSGFVHEHLVTTLGAFKQGGQWNFIFPSAAYDLEKYLEQQNPPWNRRTVTWASKQLWGIMGALDTIHNPQHLHVSGKGEKRYGRHGDIKCDNILCFQVAGASDQYVLVISDFGLSDFNRDTSRSNIPNQRIPAVPGYRPPECDIKGGLVSRAYDIWTMGCLFLEFLTWLLGGPTCLKEFQHKRETTFITGSKNNIFFDLMTCEEEGPGVYVAQVKLEVTEWIQRLRRDKNCSRFIHDVLDLIQMEMLVVLENNEGQSSGKRSSSGELKDKLERIRLKCAKEGDGGYGTLGVTEDKDPLTVPAVEVALNEFATKMVLEQKPRLRDHKGKKKKSMLPDQFKEIDNWPDPKDG
ncbi:kinase-like domain-containing protein [Dactylonectria macrodidyma]|uniref:Kinase-like domain-containing protein n=1 Tax=Dactylonectria macrodidyma TaxID=307937 RepID=A0A9P9JHI0_9HYPO|nr:kinase-like domain-containing protein [Dactylonectria macrodidyma]